MPVRWTTHARASLTSNLVNGIVGREGALGECCRSGWVPLPCVAFALLSVPLGGCTPRSKTVNPPGPERTATVDAAPAQAVYPTPSVGPPPVPPPPGEGLDHPHQRYIVVDQFGYRPDAAKVAILVNPERGWNAADIYEPGPMLEVRRWADGAVVFQGAPKPWSGGRIDETAGDRGAWFDFSEVREAGLYYVFDPARSERSHPFEVDRAVYRKLLRTAQRAFYFNRANFEKRPPYSCVGQRCWSLGADYVGPGQDREARSVREPDDPKTARELSGGWWDAGDTNKYVTFACDAVHQLLSAYEERPEVFGDDFGIPESGNGLPDLIDELRYELDWLKKMQPNDLGGGVLLKVGNVEYGDPVPDQSQFRRFYYPEPCSSATIVASGLFAHASLVFAGFPELISYAEDLRERAIRAWDHYHAHQRSDACDDGTIKSGDADRSLTHQAQDAVTAAVYLFAATQDRAYGAYVAEHHRITRPFQDERWSIYDQSQGDALLVYASLSSADPTTRDGVLGRKRKLAQEVDLYGFRPELDLYRAYMRKESYHWGSNNARAAYGNTNYALVQHGLVPEAERGSYIERAAGILSSFHGVNPMQLVYLTNMYADGGDECVDEAYHTWFRDQHPLWDNARRGLGPAPGYVTGGPNQNYCEGQDPAEHACARSPLREQPAEKAYIDSNTSWEPSNPYDKTWELTEPAIYYQASYLRLLSKFVD